MDTHKQTLLNWLLQRDLPGFDVDNIVMLYYYLFYFSDKAIQDYVILSFK